MQFFFFGSNAFAATPKGAFRLRSWQRRWRKAPLGCVVDKAFDKGVLLAEAPLGVAAKAFCQLRSYLLAFWLQRLRSYAFCQLRSLLALLVQQYKSWHLRAHNRTEYHASSKARL
jgi:hypothetical protein